MCHVYHLSNACGPSPGSDCACRFYRIRMILVKVLHICVFCSDRCKVMQHNIDDGSLTGRWIHSNHHIGLTQHFCPGLSGSEMESSVDVSAVPDASGADLGYQRRALWVAWSKSRMTWCDMHWYATYTHTITYNIQLPQDPQGPGTLHNMRNMRSMRSICSARQISKLLPVSFMSFMSLHCRHLPKGGKEVSESRRMFGTTTVAKYGYSWLLIIHKYI